MPDTECQQVVCSQEAKINKIHDLLVGTGSEPGLGELIRSNTKRIGMVEDTVKDARGLSVKAVVAAIVALGAFAWKIITAGH